MKDLQERVSKMLHGEQKRREIAIRFLEKLTEDIQDAAMELFGEQHYPGLDTCAIWLWETKMSKKIKKDIYFRYGMHPNERTGNEFPGFYLSQDVWEIAGQDIELTKGADFWWAIRTIVEWLPELQEEIEKKGISRDKLSAKLLRFIKE